MGGSLLRKRFRSIEHDLKDRFLRPARVRLAREAARAYRLALRHVCFVAVTGSCGKTTATELIAALLAPAGPVRKGSHENTIRHWPATILSVSPRHRFCVAEVSGQAAGAVAPASRLLRPRIGLVTCIGQDHYASFRNLKATAAEKGTLVERLPVDGAAVLNADDPHVYAMRTRTRARVVTYGLSPEAMVRGHNVSAVWPEPMSLDVTYAGARVSVRTQLLGVHWASTVLGALAVALSAGVTLEQAAAVIAAFPPVPYRMRPHHVPGDVTFISDAWKASLWTVPASLEFLRTARAERKILVVGSISDTAKSFADRYKAVVRQAYDMAGKLLFVGEHAPAALRARPRPDDDRVMAFETLHQLHLFLNDYLQPGDLVLLKGTANVDHLHRLVLARTGRIACWRHRCGRRGYCLDCRLLYNASAPEPERQNDQRS